MSTEVAALAGEITGTLSLASLPSVTGTLVAPQLRAFADRHPAVTIRLLEGSEQEVLDWLDQGAAEAGVVSLPIKGLDAAVLGDQDMVAVLPAENRLAGWNEVDYVELAKEPFIRSTGGCAEVFTPVARRPASTSTSRSRRARCPRCSKSSGPDSASASCPWPDCRSCPTVWWCAR